MPPERQFLHDLASPLAAALMTLDSARDCLDGQAPAAQAALKRLARASETMLRMRDMIKARRGEIIAEEKP
jgi:hypothetical protein